MLVANQSYSILLSFWLSIVFFGCQTQTIVGEQPNQVAKSAWATFNLVYPRNASDFPSAVFVTTMDSHSLGRNEDGGVEVRGKMSCKKENLCVLHPGTHSIVLDYVWSKFETVDQQRKKASRETWLSAGVLIGLVPEVAVYQNSQCRTTIEFEAQETKDYALNVIHSDRKEGPDVFQVVDTHSGDVIGRQERYDYSYESALPYSDKPVSADQCAVHLMSNIPYPMTFYINHSHPIHGYHMNHTILVEPGEQVISAASGRVSASTKSIDGETILVQCDGGEATYVRIDKVKSFWKDEFRLTELSAEEAQIVDKTILR
jgi:hypothetical protein